VALALGQEPVLAGGQALARVPVLAGSQGLAGAQALAVVPACSNYAASNK